ncbi:MAG: hypothetical protein ABSG53_24755 [Thermoguttaceae bacterium]
MSRLLSYCFVALVVEVLGAVSASGGDPFAATDPTRPAKPDAVKPDAARPAGGATDPFGGGGDNNKPAAAATGSAKPGAAKPDSTQPAGNVADPFADGGAAPPPQAATKARAVPASKKPRAPARVAPPTNRAEPAEARINDVLDAQTQIEFVETPLKDVVDYLKDLHHIEILIDSAALKEAGVDESTQITQNLKGISLRSALRLLLAQISKGEVTYAIHDEVLLITTKAKSAMTKVYDVADLVTCQDSKAKLWEDYETLIDMIRENVCPESWDPQGGQGTIKGVSLGAAKILVVWQTQQVHEEIATVLKEIRAVAAKNRREGEADWPQRDPPK